MMSSGFFPETSAGWYVLPVGVPSYACTYVGSNDNNEAKYPPAGASCVKRISNASSISLTTVPKR